VAKSSNSSHTTQHSPYIRSAGTYVARQRASRRIVSYRSRWYNFVKLLMKKHSWVQTRSGSNQVQFKHFPDGQAKQQSYHQDSAVRVPSRSFAGTYDTVLLAYSSLYFCQPNGTRLFWAATSRAHASSKSMKRSLEAWLERCS